MCSTRRHNPSLLLPHGGTDNLPSTHRSSMWGIFPSRRSARRFWMLPEAPSVVTEPLPWPVIWCSGRHRSTRSQELPFHSSPTTTMLRVSQSAVEEQPDRSRSNRRDPRRSLFLPSAPSPSMPTRSSNREHWLLPSGRSHLAGTVPAPLRSTR